MTTNAILPKNCVIVGLGQTGLACARFMLEQGVDVAMMDTREQPPELVTIQQNHPEVLIHTGGLSADWLLQAGQIVLSPGIDPRLPEIQTARAAGVEIVGDIELFARYAKAPVIAITGSNGKSTVTTLVTLMAQLSGRQVLAGGNLGTPALELLSQPVPDFYILELSSFQLETVRSLNAFAAAVLNISADHLDRYDSLNEYIAAKARIFQGDGVMVVNRDDPVVMALADNQRQIVGFSLKPCDGPDFGLRSVDDSWWICQGDYELLSVNELKIAGQHNLSNALAALALGNVMGLSTSAMLSALREFKGLPHRCRLVRERRGVKWYNDSKATNVGATLAAIEGLSANGKQVVILGGVGKGQQFDALTPVLERHAHAVVLIGDAAELIAEVVPGSVIREVANSLKAAVNKAALIAESGMQVLLSPACASFDMFSSYVDRGQQFEHAVRELQP
ncbi:UDP-N-acetylmuramoylalanine--D-glutamate ligase [Methylophaga frappieri]|uniref:UDP-N-acetylmuramoylalanine--D-glutamate ligase n=1 Tax=Methylophaga frappieri (strain ATCC BAA-2434 / DSM 25690 / JAM7) TaxID=754477 RepID=I1YGJ7_METFJ|nr:UDP-N-acetylmuramoyl-L-alanine--D-glutamate ligase [Methylophaga frappieri]AFJ02040.1 UDP-N-acetylmuramoylalanine--D-glutamate ligase [Methylophaga frappieri]